MSIKLEHLGFSEKMAGSIKDESLAGFEIGRVTAEHKERYIIRTADAEYDAEITGNMRFSAQGREDFPAVGDWVALMAYDSDFAVIHKILPRFSIIRRQAVGHRGEVQLIATNIDFAFLVQAADRDFNINRLERYLTICYASKVEPIIILTKTDLVEPSETEKIIHSVKCRVKEVPVIAVSNLTREGIGDLTGIMQPGKTYCLLGSSGVGKSSLLNNLSGKEQMKTGNISESTSKGRHVTTHRELIVLENGAILIDNPGMREVGIADTESGLETTFDDIYELGQKCKYSDCTHTREAGCAVLEALESGEIDPGSYENYIKLEKEKAHFESTSLERKRKDKELGKVIKNFKKEKKFRRL
jgi:ribosome biogenesis GTPase